MACVWRVWGEGLVIASVFMCVTGSHERGDGDDEVMGE